MQEAEIEIARRTVLSNAAGLAMLALVRSCFAQASAENAYQGRNRTMDVKRNGSRPPSKGPEAWFTGTVRVDPLFQVGDPQRLSGGQVTFEPGARTMWHTHPLGQTLIVTSGLGWAQCEGGPISQSRNRSTARMSTGWKRSATSTIENDGGERKYDDLGI